MIQDVPWKAFFVAMYGVLVHLGDLGRALARFCLLLYTVFQLTLVI